MLALLCSWVLAAEPVTEAATYDRLFGDGSTTPVTAAVPEPGMSLPIWLLPLTLAGLVGGFFLWKERQPKQFQPSAALRVVQRQSLGDRNAVVLLEVIEPNGEVHRLLVGTGSGAPTLITDLGLSEAPLPAPSPSLVAPELPAANRAPVENRSEGRLEGRPNIADEILAERGPKPPSPSKPGSNAFSRLLARIGD